MNRWSSALTIRAAASYFFITEVKCKAAPFTQNFNRLQAGNLVTLTAVKLYMQGLKKQKVQVCPCNLQGAQANCLTIIGLSQRDLRECARNIKG